MAAKKKIEKEEEKTTIEKVLHLFEKYQAVTRAIVEDYIGGPGMTTELAAADDNLYEAIAALKEDETTFDFLLDKMNDLSNKELNPEKLIDLAISAYDYETEHLVNKLEADDIELFANNNSYCLVKVPNMNHRDKLEDFIKTEIYPNYTDQVTNLIM